MNKEGAVLAARILTELKEISKLVCRIEQGWKKAKKREDELYKKYFKVHDAPSIPPRLRGELKSIFKEELT